MNRSKISYAGVAFAVTLTLTACAPAATPDSSHSATTSSHPPVQSIPVADEVFGPALWSAQAASGTRPFVLGKYVILLDGTDLTVLDQQGNEQWQSDVAPLPSPSGNGASREVVPVTDDVIALVDHGLLPSGSDPLAVDTQGSQVTLLSVSDGSELATQTIPGDSVKRTVGLAFEVADNGAEHLAISTTGEQITPKDGKLPIATIGEHIIWGEAYTANMGVQMTVASGLPLENATVRATDNRQVVVLGSYDGKADTIVWVNLATGTALVPDNSCSVVPAPKELTSSSNGEYVTGGNAIANLTNSTISCVGGGANQKPVSMEAVTDSGRAYGRTADTADTFVIFQDSEVETHAIPADAAPTRLIGFVNEKTAILFDARSGTINANPLQ